ncbi:MAG: hypothetical protein K0U38_01365, partial [Epsilonproteobacteria bacterium]|nr:hypothetical protein [Campylobacterota bacterium]
LKCIYPKSLDVEMINYYDYFSLHSKDVGGEESLHPDVPNRSGELSVKRGLIQDSLKMLMLKGLVEHSYTKSGIEYIASEEVAPFIDNLSAIYTQDLIKSVTWVCNHFKNMSAKEIRGFVFNNKHKWGSEISYCTVGNIDE